MQKTRAAGFTLQEKIRHEYDRKFKKYGYSPILATKNLVIAE